MKTKLWQSMILIWNKASLTWATDIVYIMILFLFYIGILILWNDAINLSGWYCGREWESIGCKLIGLLKGSKGAQYSTVHQLIMPLIISPIHLWIPCIPTDNVYKLCTNWECQLFTKCIPTENISMSFLKNHHNQEDQIFTSFWLASGKNLRKRRLVWKKSCPKCVQIHISPTNDNTNATMG